MLRGWRGALLGGTCFILPGLIVILALSALFVESRPPHWVEGAAAGTGSAVAAVALNAALGLALPSWARAGPRTTARLRWAIYALAGAVAAATIGPYLVLVLLCAALAELAWRAAVAAPTGGIGALAWVALKVGGLSYGGGFVIVPLMQTDAVHHCHWTTSAQFLNAVALGGGRHFGRIRASSTAQGFLAGAGPAAIGAIAGAAVPLGLALAHVWQLGVLAGALVWLVARRGNVVLGLVGAGLIGVAGSLLGLPVG